MGLSASARIKKRYLLLDAESEKKVKETVLEYIGLLGWAKATPVFVKHDKGIILSVDRSELNNVLAAFAASKNRIKVMKVSGTISGL